jgi:hypothetical protein
MNLHIKDATYIANGEETSYWKMSQIYVRGNNIASIRFQEDLLDRLEEERDNVTNIPRKLNNNI